ncbi:TetR/AcrR family transcriptional regulator [Asanoa sp. NPDC050611]|uniref:TetR/AcrR family transcriptional regulator n=1 Tax=Asanoa sp. NPDC050611 TaxID=3157098 RepID=UPI0033D6D08F
MGLREIKKEQTRERIAAAAWRLFADRGFDQATVADVAREAEVSLATVFNYFNSKEELFYRPLEAFGTRLIDAIRTRDAGEPVLAAFRRFLSESTGLLARIEAGDPEAMRQAHTVNRVIADSPALQARERQALARTTDDLAVLLADENGTKIDDVHAYVVANALMGVHRALVEHVRRRILTDDHPTDLAADVRNLAGHAFALLEQGLGDYAPKPEN